jgi:hypothetical protein
VKLQDDWDDEERRALAGIERSSTNCAPAMPATRRSSCRGPRTPTLPDSLQASLTEHLKRSAWSRALIDGDAEQPLDADAEHRLLAGSTVHRVPSRRPVGSGFRRSRRGVAPHHGWAF